MISCDMVGGVMSNFKISVIIPMYNAEKYITRCLDSLLNQTYTDLEILVVNDGSVDGCVKICEDYEKKDSRIRVIHQKNQGVSKARNTGLETATGAYIAYVDSDDYVDSCYFEKLYTGLVTHHADLACCNYYEILNGEVVHINAPKVLRSRVITDGVELYRDLIAYQEAYGTCVWGKLFTRELARCAQFKALKIGEDQLYMFDIFSRAPAVWLDEYTGYYYVRNEDSATAKNAKWSISRSVNELEMYERMITSLPDFASSCRNQYIAQYAFAIHVLAHSVVRSPDRAERAKYRPEICNRIRAVLRNNNALSIRVRIYLSLYLNFPALYRAMIVMKDKLYERKNNHF